MYRFIVVMLLLISSSTSQASVGQFLYETNRSFEAWLTGVTQHSVTVGDDQWVYYARNTERDICTVLVHGFTAEAAHWFRFARKLSAAHCLIIPDLPGFGASHYDAEGDYSIPRQAERLNAFLAQVKPGSKLHLVGSSMGGHIVATYALNYPANVATLTLFDAAGVESAQPSYANKFLASTGRPIFFVEKRADFFHLTAHSMSDAPWMPGMVMDYLADQFIARNERHMRIFSQINNQNRIDTRLAEIKMPTLIIWGSEDNLLDKSMGDAYARGIANAQYQVMEKIGHLPFLEAPAASAQQFEGFLSKHGFDG